MLQTKSVPQHPMVSETENRHAGTGDRGQGTGDRGQGTGGLRPTVPRPELTGLEWTVE